LAARDIPGEFEYHKQIGATSAYFSQTAHMERAIDRLSSDYVFIRDFQMSLPTPIKVDADEGPSTEPPDDASDLAWRDAAGINKAQKDGYTGQGILLGMLDTGIDADHTEFRVGQRYITHGYVPILPRKPVRRVRGFDTDGHGTHVAGILFGRRLGIAPGSQLLVGGVIESETVRTSFMRVVKGVDWLLRAFSKPDVADRPAIVNMSLGFPPAVPPGMSNDEYQVLERALRHSIGQLVRADVLVVAAIGNDGYGHYRLPAMYPEVLAVGAVDYQNDIASFSGCSPNPADGKPNLVGYGVGVYSAYQRNIRGRSQYAALSGTSMASPYAAGIAALLWSKNPHLDSQSLRDILIESASHISGPQPERFGAGLAVYS
jgi:subtilisin family serine protease